MNWQAFITTFGMLLIAELGDKTQLAVVMQAAKFQKPWMVLLGASLALILVSALGTCVGHVCGLYLPREIIGRVAGGVFIVMGVLMVFRVL
ncbi:MAG: TMEM165/GDT1 family protein [Armatimonadetes bacterium]|nr:TMEM165/GDT1 family protein [Armatimonadota bacterium]